MLCFRLPDLLCSLLLLFFLLGIGKAEEFWSDYQTQVASSQAPAWNLRIIDSHTNLVWLVSVLIEGDLKCFLPAAGVAPRPVRFPRRRGTRAGGAWGGGGRASSLAASPMLVSENRVTQFRACEPEGGDRNFRQCNWQCNWSANASANFAGCNGATGANRNCSKSASDSALAKPRSACVCFEGPSTK